MLGIKCFKTAQCRSSLRVLNLSGVKHLTDASILLISQACPNLITLDLTRMGNLSDRSLVFTYLIFFHQIRFYIYASFLPLYNILSYPGFYL